MSLNLKNDKNEKTEKTHRLVRELAIGDGGEQDCRGGRAVQERLEPVRRTKNGGLASGC